VPVRLIDGLLDPVSGARMVTRYRELIRIRMWSSYPNVGHYPQLEAPEGHALGGAAVPRESRAVSRAR